jgi:hypothetical protein
MVIIMTGTFARRFVKLNQQVQVEAVLLVAVEAVEGDEIVSYLTLR